MIPLETLLKHFDIAYEKHQLERAITHNSFSENNNSRYVFLGMFAFKGAVAAWVFNHVAGTGTQLQQYLGNLFKQPFLETFFDKNIKQITKIDPKIDLNTQKHIFAYAFLGFVYDNATEEQLNDFIFHQIIKQKLEKQQKHIARNLAHQEKMRVRQEDKKKQAQEEDRKRRLAKEKAKEKKTSSKGVNTIYREYTLEEIKEMSASKRRNLQDKGIIPKGLNF